LYNGERIKSLAVKMKLELKHLAPYLPYGLKLQGTENKIFGIKDAQYELFKLSKGLNGNAIMSGRVRSKLGGTFSVVDFEIRKDADLLLKPILRPLSDIKKPILINDEVVVFYSRHDLRIDEGCFCDVYDAYYGESPKAFVPITEINWWMFEYHFDVFGLITAGLAIDINTLP